MNEVRTIFGTCVMAVLGTAIQAFPRTGIAMKAWMTGPTPGHDEGGRHRSQARS